MGICEGIWAEIVGGGPCLAAFLPWLEVCPVFEMHASAPARSFLRHAEHAMDTNSPLPDIGTPLERIDGIAVLRPSGQHRGTQSAIDRITAVLASAAGAGLDRCALDITGMVGFPAPTLSERHAMVRDWAAAVDGRMVVAMVCVPELLDPERFGVVAAANFGLRAGAFDNIRDAIAWLRES
jgi:hypothetical protein